MSDVTASGDPVDLANTLWVVADVTGLDLAVGGVPEGWATVTDLWVAAGELDRTLARIEHAYEAPRRSASLISVASWWSWSLAVPLATAAVTTGRAWTADPAHTGVRLADGGWVEAIRIAPAPVFDVDERGIEDVADDVLRLMEPLYRLVLTRGRVARRALWGTFADLVGWAAAAATRTGAEPQRSLEVADRLLDAVAERVEHPVPRPTIQAVATPYGSLLFSIKGTCCLSYTCHCEDPLPDGDAYCNTCPFRSAASRAARLHAVTLAEWGGTDDRTMTNHEVEHA